MNKKKARELLEFINRKWDDLVCNAQGKKKIGKNRNDILYLPYDYVVPNKEKFDTMFYWDSYFIIQGLKTEGRDKLINNITNNCLYEVETYGKVLNANKQKWSTRSQLPYLALMVKDVYDIYQNKKWLKKAFDTAKREYKSYWLNKHHLTPTGLSRFYDESGRDKYESHTCKSRAEASWDMSPRFDDSDIHDLAPIDLNCNLYQYEKYFEKFSLDLGNKKEAMEWRKRKKKRRENINKLMWDEKDGLFYDYNFKNREKKKIKSLAAYQAMFTGLANRKQAERMRNILKVFETKEGLVTCDKDYEYSDRQWNWPIIWAPLQYICCEGLKKYGYRKEANRVAKKFVNLVYKNWNKTGKIWEKYNGKIGNSKVPYDRYPNQSGFGWTNAVTEVFIKDIYII